MYTANLRKANYLQENCIGKETRYAFTKAHFNLVGRFTGTGSGFTVFLAAHGRSVGHGVRFKRNDGAWTFMIAVWSYPIWPIIFTVAAWIACARKKDRLAAILTTFTFLPVLVLIVILGLSSVFYSFAI